MKRIAAVALRQYKHEVDTDFDMESNSLSVKLVKVILGRPFYLGQDVRWLPHPRNVRSWLRELGINWGVQQRREVFNTLDRHQHDGQVFFEEFFAVVAPHLSRMVDELQGHQPEKNEWTPNLNEVFEFLEEAHKDERLEAAHARTISSRKRKAQRGSDGAAAARGATMTGVKYIPRGRAWRRAIAASTATAARSGSRTGRGSARRRSPPSTPALPRPRRAHAHGRNPRRRGVFADQPRRAGGDARKSPDELADERLRNFVSRKAKEPKPKNQMTVTLELRRVLFGGNNNKKTPRGSKHDDPGTLQASALPQKTEKKKTNTAQIGKAK